METTKPAGYPDYQFLPNLIRSKPMDSIITTSNHNLDHILYFFYNSSSASRHRRL